MGSRASNSAVSEVTYTRTLEKDSYQIAIQEVLEVLPIDITYFTRSYTSQDGIGSSLEQIDVWAYHRSTSVKSRLVRAPFWFVQLNTQD